MAEFLLPGLNIPDSKIPPKSCTNTQHQNPLKKEIQKINYSQLKVDILKAIRSPLSQRQFSKDLGFQFNQSLKWETQQKIFTWLDFCKVCEFKKLNLGEVLSNVFCITMDPKNTSEFTKHLIKIFYPDKNILAVAEQLNLQSSVIKRWFSGKSQPHLEIILQIIHSNTQLLGEFLTQLLPSINASINPTHELAEFVNGLRQIRNFEAELPFVSAIQSCLHLDSYHKLEKHSDSFVADRTALPIWKVKEAIVLLQQKGLISWDSNTQKYSSPKLRVDMGGISTEEILSLSSFWTERALVRITDPVEAPINRRKNQNFIGYRIVPASKESIKKINEVLIQASNKILQILEEDNNPLEEIRIILHHHFSADDYPK